jgi:predicted PurR-regulated permease PerM
LNTKIITSGRLIAAILVIAACYFSGAVLVPIFCAVFAAIALDPWVTRLTNRGVNRGISAGIVLLLFSGGIFATSSFGYRAIVRTAAHAPFYSAHLEKWQSAIWGNAQAPTLNGPASAAPPAPNVYGPSRVHLPSWQDMALRFAGSMFEFISLALFVPLLIFYLLLDKENLVESFNNLAGKLFYLPKLNSEVPAMIRAFFRGNLLGWIALAICHGALFAALGLANAGSLAVVCGFLNLIPVIGAPLALVLPLAEAFATWSELWPFLTLAGGTIAFHFIVGNIVLPQFIGPRINVNAGTLVVGLIFWGWMWGGMGLLLAIPLTATVKIFLDSNVRTRPLANLFSARPRHVLGAGPRPLTRTEPRTPPNERIAR